VDGERKPSSYRVKNWRYLGVSQNLTDAPCDHLGLKG